LYKKHSLHKAAYIIVKQDHKIKITISTQAVMTKTKAKLSVHKSLRVVANAIYYLALATVLTFIVLGFLAKANFNSKDESGFLPYGASIFKYPGVNRYLLISEKSSSLRKQGLIQDQLLSLNNCKVAEYSSLEALYSCAQIGQVDKLELVANYRGKPQTFQANLSLDETKNIPVNLPYFALDSLLLLVSLGLSLLLFFKARHYLAGYLLSFSLLLNVCESRFFYYGSSLISDTLIETIRINIAMVVGPLAMYFFPQAFSAHFYRSKWFIAIVLCVVTMLISYHLFLHFQSLSLVSFALVVSFSLLVIIAHFIAKYRSVLNVRERKQVLTMTYCVAFGFILYLPLMLIGDNYYGLLIARYIIVISVGIGVFIALMRYGLWQVETLISKSATLSLLSVIAFSFWAGLDQGMQALLNQTIGLSNKTLTAFLAAAISSFFAVPAYNFVSKSCDSFFNKNLYQLKRLLSKDILVLAETQTLPVFVNQLCKRLLELSGARTLKLSFEDVQRLPNPIHHEVSSNAVIDAHPIINNESFEYEVANILQVAIHLEFADRRINREIKEELNEGIDEIARSLASCSRWNYLETTDPSKRGLRPQL